MAFTLPPLPYPADALEPAIDKMTMEIHHGRHHKTYIANIKENALGQFGSGWSWLAVDKAGKLLAVKSPNQDSPLSEGHTPILGIDVWEHAYYLKYQNKRADYVDAWWTVVNWTKVGERF